MSQLGKRADVKDTPRSMCTTRLMMSASPTPPEKQAIRNQNINKLPLKKRFNASSSEFNDKQENDEHIKTDQNEKIENRKEQICKKKTERKTTPRILPGVIEQILTVLLHIITTTLSHEFHLLLSLIYNKGRVCSSSICSNDK